MPDGFGVTQTAEHAAVTAAPRATAPLPAPLQLREAARYDLIGEHGRGGLGRVLRAHDKELGRDIAIKELLERTNASEMRFFREALITARLEHPNIVPVHEAGRWADGTPFYAMKLVAGRSLRDLIEAATSPADRLALLPNVIAVADAIAYAHDRRVIHRDLKPANVIVGEFGETVVIDWGLAKVIDEAEGPADTPYRVAARDELTAAGSVLGTPAYMAPEQYAGKADERSDIYALGAMLHAVISGESPLARRTVPAGTPRDLVAIVDRAMADDPRDRYRSVVDFAADLRRFIRHERVAARRYSLAGRLALAVARHRTLSVTVVAASIVVTAILAVAVARIAAERGDAEAARNDLTLKHAELLLKSDPTAAFRALADYRGDDQDRRRQLEAEARGRGVAREVLTAHPNTIYFAVGEADGAIVSIGEEGRIVRSRGATTLTLATDASRTVRYAYAPAHRLLAYATAPAGITVLDLATLARTRLPGAAPAEGLAFSSDETQLATVDHEGALAVWTLAPRPAVSFRTTVARPVLLAFVGPARVVAITADGLRSIALDGGPERAHPFRGGAFDSNAHYFVAGDPDGSVTVLTPALDTIATVAACPVAVRSIAVAADDQIAFGCKDGSIGLARLAAGKLAIVDRFTVPSPLTHVWIDARAIYASSDTALFVHDLASGLTARRDGQPTSIFVVAPPTPVFPAIIAADVQGTIRVWDAPAPAARVVARVAPTTFGAAFAPDSRTIATWGTDGAIHLIDIARGAIADLRGHTGWVDGVQFAADGQTLASFSRDGTARAWRRSDGTCTHVVTDHHAIIRNLAYADRGSALVTAGEDGTLRAWSPAGGDAVVRLRRQVPVVAVEPLGGSGAVVAQDATGAIWRVAGDGETRQLRGPDQAVVTILRSSADGAYVALGTERGDVTVYRASDWTVAGRAEAAGRIVTIQFDPRGRDAIAIAEDGKVHVLTIGGVRRFAASAIPIKARDIAYAPDGELIALAVPDGGTWFHAPATGAWVYVRDHGADHRTGRFSPDGQWLVSVDGGGSVVLRDVAATMRTAQ